MLVAAGVSKIFGNPGTTELPLLDRLATDTRIKYILGLQEVPVMAMADGYAQASRHLGVVNLHTACGLGHGMGLAGLLLAIAARFVFRNELLRHFNGPEPLGLRLNAFWTLLFGGLYFQFHFNRINEQKRRLGVNV